MDMHPDSTKPDSDSRGEVAPKSVSLLSVIYVVVRLRTRRCGSSFIALFFDAQLRLLGQSNRR
jgi:hypothetical protein